MLTEGGGFSIPTRESPPGTIPQATGSSTPRCAARSVRRVAPCRPGRRRHGRRHGVRPPLPTTSTGWRSTWSATPAQPRTSPRKPSCGPGVMPRPTTPGADRSPRGFWPSPETWPSTTCACAGPARRPADHPRPATVAHRADPRRHGDHFPLGCRSRQYDAQHARRTRLSLPLAALGYTAKEISEAEGVPLGTAKTRIRRRC